MSLGTSTQAAPARPRGAIEVRWEAPPGCPDEQAVRAAVERHVGHPLAQIRDRKLSIIATAHPAETHWSLTVFTVTPEGTQERSLRYAHGCAPLAAAAAVLIAMTIDPQVLGRLDPRALELLTEVEEAAAAPPPESESQPEPALAPAQTTSEVAAVLAPPPSPPAPPQTPPAPLQPPAPQSSPRKLDPRGVVRLSGSLGHGDIPSVGGGLAGALGLRLGRWFQAELTGGGWFLRSVKLDLPNSAGATFNLWNVGLRGGAVLPLGRRLEIPLLLGVEAGQIRVRGVQLIRASDTRTPWAAVTLSTGLAFVPLPALAVVLGLDGFIAVTRPRFVVENVGEIFRPRALGLRVSLGIELRFGGKGRRRSP